jgi:hypothetical protein
MRKFPIYETEICTSNIHTNAFLTALKRIQLFLYRSLSILLFFKSICVLFFKHILLLVLVWNKWFDLYWISINLSFAFLHWYLLISGSYFTYTSFTYRQKENKFWVTILPKLMVNFTLWKFILRIWWFNSGVQVLMFDRTQYLAFTQIMGKVHAKRRI